MDDQRRELAVQAKLLSEVVRRILYVRADTDLTDRPEIKVKPIVEFMKRMRVSSVAIFNGRTFISTVNFYESEKNLQNHKSLGAIILYMPEDYIFRILSRLQYPIDDEEDVQGLEDGCGAFCNLIAGNFKSGLLQLGYKELAMSHFTTSQNDVVDGVEIYPGVAEAYEIGYEIRGEKCLVTDLCLGPLPKVDLLD